MTHHQTVELLSSGLETPQKSIKRWMTMLRYKPGHRWPHRSFSGMMWDAHPKYQVRKSAHLWNYKPMFIGIYHIFNEFNDT